MSAAAIIALSWAALSALCIGLLLWLATAQVGPFDD